MVDEQLKRRGITDARVLDAMRRIPRHRFVEEGLAHNAYEDHPLPIGEGQTISQPYIVALMTSLLGLTGQEKVLEVGSAEDQVLTVVERAGGETRTRQCGECKFVKLVGKYAWES